MLDKSRADKNILGDRVPKRQGEINDLTSENVSCSINRRAQIVRRVRIARRNQDGWQCQVNGQNLRRSRSVSSRVGCSSIHIVVAVNQLVRHCSRPSSAIHDNACENNTVDADLNCRTSFSRTRNRWCRIIRQTTARDRNSRRRRVGITNITNIITI